MFNLTVVILTKNEQDNIVEVINNVKKCADDILVVDSFSTDNTIRLAKANGARVVCRELDNDFSEQRNFALTQTQAKWILYVDADERLSDELINNIKSIVVTNEDKQCIIKRKSVAFGQEFNYGVLRADFVVRLFPRASVKWINKVHEQPLCSLPKKKLAGYIKHYTYNNWDQYFNKFNQYTSIWAQNAHERNKKSSIVAAFFHASADFFQMLVIQKGFLDGKLGFVLSLNHFFYVWVKYIKLRQLRAEQLNRKKKN
ncbi:glycosyltransferase family 2 protein [Endomicrobium proavitum]|nr:glycosyltransferase family 2 protein [Endomicrobium proavitum]